MLLKLFSRSVLLFICGIIISCNRYIDKITTNNGLPERKGYLELYCDSNIFTYKTNVTLTRDREKIYPKSFKVKLPKGLKSYEITGSSDFSFYYKKDQVVFIRVDLENDKSIRDTSYIPSENELEKIIESKLTLGKSKYNLKEIAVNPKRRRIFIKRKAITILLYNIENRNYDLFYEYANSFHFIEK